MDITFTWKIDNMTRDESGMVKTVFWTLWAEKNGIVDKNSSATDLEPSDDPIPFDDLNQEVISSWIESIIDPDRLDDIKHFLSEQINYKLITSESSEFNSSSTLLDGLPPSFNI